MPVNEAITSGLVFSGTVPADQECQISNLTEIINGVIANTAIQTTSPDGTPTPPDNSIAEQALNTANQALALAQSVQSAQKESRASSPQAIPTGDNQIAFSWAPAMPSTNYSIMLTLYAGNTTFPTERLSVRVLESSITVDGFIALVENIPANTKLGFYAIMR